MGYSIVQEYDQDSMASGSDYVQKIRQEEERAIRKREVKAPTNFTESSSPSISKTPSF